MFLRKNASLNAKVKKETQGVSLLIPDLMRMAGEARLFSDPPFPFQEGGYQREGAAFPAIAERRTAHPLPDKMNFFHMYDNFFCFFILEAEFVL